MEEKETQSNETNNNYKGDYSQKNTSSRTNDFLAKKIIRKIGDKLTPEELESKQKLIIQISRFRDSSRFANFLNSLGFNLSPTHLKSMDIGQLEDLLIELKSAIQNKNGSKFIDESYFMVLNMVENISKHPKFNKYGDLTGLSKSARENDELLDTLECLSLMYSDLGQLSPEKKLVFLTGSCILQTASLNRMLKNIQNYEQKLKEQVDLTSQQNVAGTDTHEKIQKGVHPSADFRSTSIALSGSASQNFEPNQLNDGKIHVSENIQVLNFDMIK
jgi:hypothetical protein